MPDQGGVTLRPTSVGIPGLTRVGLNLPEGQLTLGEWVGIGRQLATYEKALSWAIGDWLNYGEAERLRDDSGLFLEQSRYVEAVDATGFDKGSLYNAAWVAGRFAVSRRRESVAFGIHQELAALTIEEQEAWLDRVVEENLTRAQLRDMLRDRPPGLSEGKGVSEMVQATRFVLRIEPDQNSRWESAAEAAGMGLAAWAVSVLDREAQEVAA